MSGNGYLGLNTLKTYNVEECAAACGSTPLCTAFNIFAERDPSWYPSSKKCPNPPSMTSFKCTLFGASITKADATWTGEVRAGFHVVVSGSNGYVKTDSTPGQCAGWEAPKKCPGGAVQPRSGKKSKHMGGHFFPGPFNPAVCAGYAAKQTEENRRSCKTKGQKYAACNAFNAYEVKKEGRCMGTYCNLFTDHLGDEYGTLTTSFSAGISWSFDNSYIFARSEFNAGISV